MMVVPAPRAIPPLSFSESRPKTVRVESSTANIKPATANTPTITGRKFLRYPGMGVLLLQSRGGRYSPPPPLEYGLDYHRTWNTLRFSFTPPTGARASQRVTKFFAAV